MNIFCCIGRLTKDPEMRYAQNANGTAVAKFTIAIDRQRKKEGEPSADFLNCVAFGKTAETISKYFTKGRRIAVNGHIQTGSYKAKDGHTVYTTDILVDAFYFCDSQNAPAVTTQHAQAPAPDPQPDPDPIPDWEQDDLEGDLPF